MKYEFNEEQIGLIRTALENYYHVSKDEDESHEVRDAITDLEMSIINQTKQNTK